MSQIEFMVGCASETLVDGDESAMAGVACEEGSYRWHTQ